ncbi:unnamed protein product [Strongylus vulgaris]|uniref:Uncharacterized protein n=1 Tax=Strongylus vulgaris TaxID=40348 RepID=A0A3P7IV14_STRVU|nr:unnamed protein product [Strongylus vulgaris]
MISSFLSSGKSLAVRFRRTHSDRNLLVRPRSPSMPTVHTSADHPRIRETMVSRVTSRSVSPANGVAVKEVPINASRSQEKASRVTMSSRPPREPRRAVHATNSNEPVNSAHGLSLNDFVIKMEKEHYMTVMQAEKTALG